MDFGFISASTSDYKQPNKQTDRVVLSYEGYSAYLIIVDGTSRRLWVFLTQSKEPPLDIVRAFMTKFGIGGGCVRTDQGGKLAHSDLFRNMFQKEFQYVVEPTGSDCPPQNGAAEINTMTNWRSKSAPSSTDLASLPNFGLQHSYTQSISTIDSSTLSQK
jgi:hypothetical protein